MQQPVSGMHIEHGLMHRCSTDFGLGGGPNRKSHAMTSSNIFKKRAFYETKNERSEVKGLVWSATRILLQGKDWNRKLKSFTNISKLEDVVSKLELLKRITDGAWGCSPQPLGNFS